MQDTPLWRPPPPARARKRKHLRQEPFVPVHAPRTQDCKRAHKKGPPGSSGQVNPRAPARRQPPHPFQPPKGQHNRGATTIARPLRREGGETRGMLPPLPKECGRAMTAKGPSGSRENKKNSAAGPTTTNGANANGVAVFTFLFRPAAHKGNLAAASRFDVRIQLAHIPELATRPGHQTGQDRAAI